VVQPSVSFNPTTFLLPPHFKKYPYWMTSHFPLVPHSILWHSLIYCLSLPTTLFLHEVKLRLGIRHDFPSHIVSNHTLELGQQLKYDFLSRTSLFISYIWYEHVYIYSYVYINWVASSLRTVTQLFPFPSFLGMHKTMIVILILSTWVHDWGKSPHFPKCVPGVANIGWDPNLSLPLF
jgi:hypothetical protein